MSIEEKLKGLILSRYRSLREFTQEIDMPYQTMDSILKRGVDKASISNIIKICKALDISADELANGNIVPNSLRHTMLEMTEVIDILDFVKFNLLERADLTISGISADEGDLQLLSDGITITIELLKKRKLLQQVTMPVTGHRQRQQHVQLTERDKRLVQYAVPLQKRKQ